MRHNWLDGMAIGASALCLVHCLALPFILLALPALSLAFGADENIHIIILLFAVPTSAYALFSGHGVHRNTVPMLVGLCGLVLLSLGLWFEEHPRIETLATVSGSLSLAFGHVANWRLRARSAFQS